MEQLLGTVLRWENVLVAIATIDASQLVLVMYVGLYLVLPKGVKYVHQLQFVIWTLQLPEFKMRLQTKLHNVWHVKNQVTFGIIQIDNTNLISKEDRKL